MDNPSKLPPPGKLKNIDYESIARSSRPLNKRERELVKNLFGDSLNPDTAFIGYDMSIEGTNILGYVNPKTGSKNVAYFPPDIEDTFGIKAHELTHIYQNRRGQKPQLNTRLEKYDYGGIEGLKKANGDLTKFNQEQQANITKDYLTAKPEDKKYYQPYINNIKKNKTPIYETDPSEVFLNSVRNRINRKENQDEFSQDLKARFGSLSNYQIQEKQQFINKLERKREVVEIKNIVRNYPEAKTIIAVGAKLLDNEDTDGNSK